MSPVNLSWITFAYPSFVPEVSPTERVNTMLFLLFPQELTALFVFLFASGVIVFYFSLRDMKARNKKIEEDLKHYSAAFTEASEKLIEKDREISFMKKILEEKNQELTYRTEKMLELHQLFMKQNAETHKAVPAFESPSASVFDTPPHASTENGEHNIVLDPDGKILFSGAVPCEQDEALLKKTINIVEQNISDPELNSERICRELGMSKSVLYVRLKNLTGQTVNEFIRIIRLKKSTSLLAEGKLTITQISHDMGFNSPSYYSRSFAQLFGISPKEYVQQMKPGVKEV